MPHFQVRAHVRLIRDLSTAIAAAAPGLEGPTAVVAQAVEALGELYELSPLRHVRFSEVATGLGGVEVLLEEARDDVRAGRPRRAVDKCHIALRLVEQLRSAISQDRFRT